MKAGNQFIKTKAWLCLAAFLLSLIIILPVLSGCKQENTGEDTTVEETTAAETLPPAPEKKTIDIVKNGETEYVIVRPVDVKTALASSVTVMAKTISSSLYNGEKSKLEVTNDYIWNDQSVKEKEILIGATNREESAKAVEGLAEGDWTVRMIGTKLVIAGTDEAATTEALDWFTLTFIDGFTDLQIPDELCYTRSASPTILSMSQEDYYYNLSTNSPEIAFTIGAPDGSDPELIELIIDGRNALSTVSRKENVITISGISFESGMHMVSMTLKAKNGTMGYEVFHFGCGDCDDMHLYIGELHAHTTDSDGIGTPEEAYNYARNVAKLDFFAVTDHSNSHSAELYADGHVALADRLNTPGRFVALYGYEQGYGASTGYSGHLNSINSTVFTKNSLYLYDYYQKMAETEGAIVQFNHPGYSWGNFNEYAGITEEADSVVNLYEFKGSGYDNEWALCLSRGWHVSPMHNEDNHTGNWGTVNEAVGVVLAPSLTRQNIVEAMSMNRSYTTTDQSLKIYFSVNDTWMGGRLDAPSSLKVKVKLTTEKRTGLGNIYIVAEDNIVVASVNAGTAREYEWELDLSPEYDYYYVKVNGSSGFAVTAPVWVENRDLLNVTDLDRGLIVFANNSNKDQRVTALVSNDSDKTITDVTVSFYQSALSGFALSSQKPVATVKLGSLLPGASATAKCDVAYSLSTPRVTAVVTGKVGDELYGDTRCLMLNDLIITEVATSAAGYGYIEIYNATNETRSLSGISLRYWPKPGAKSDDLAAVTYALSGSIPAHSSMVLWLQTKSTISVSDFNKHYSCSLTEGKNLLVVKSTWTTKLSGSMQIELLNGTTVITRACYNFDPKYIDSIESRSVEYAYKDDYTLTSIKTGSRKKPTPGTVADSAVPTLIAKAS